MTGAIGTTGRERRRAAVRQAILDAARTIVREQGLAALTMRRIAELVDYSPAALYAHFENRDALLAELCREGSAALRGALERATEGAADPVAQLAALADAYVRFAREQPDEYHLMFMEDIAVTRAAFTAAGSEDGRRGVRLLRGPFAALREAGVLRQDADPARLADLFWVTLHGVASLRIAAPTLPGTDDATLLATAVATLVGGWRAGVNGEGPSAS